MNAYHQTPNPTRLRIQCWCGARYGERTAADIRAGRTFSCSTDCTPDRALTRAPVTAGRRKKTAA